MQAKATITWSNGTTWVRDEVETSYGDEPLYYAVQELQDKGFTNEHVNALTGIIRGRHGSNGELNLIPGTTWDATHKGTRLVITAK